MAVVSETHHVNSVYCSTTRGYRHILFEHHNAAQPAGKAPGASSSFLVVVPSVILSSSSQPYGLSIPHEAQGPTAHPLALQLRVAAHRLALPASPSQLGRVSASLLLPATLPPLSSLGSLEEAFKTQRHARRGAALCAASPHEKPRPPHGSLASPLEGARERRRQRPPTAPGGAGRGAAASRLRHGHGSGSAHCPNRPLRSLPARGAARPLLRLPLCAYARNPPPPPRAPAFLTYQSYV